MTAATDKPKSAAQRSREARQTARESLARIIRRDAGVMVMETYQSKSGAAHHIIIIAADPQDNTPRDITATVARALDYRMNRKGSALVANGGGMNMRADVAMAISAAVFGDPYALHFVESYIA